MGPHPVRRIMAVLHIKGDTSMSNNTPSAQDILDAIQHKDKIRVSMHDKLRKMLKNNGAVNVQLPGGKGVTITEREIDPLTDTTSLDMTVLEALEKAMAMYEIEDDGVAIHAAITNNTPVKVSKKQKKKANEMFDHFAKALFQKKLAATEDLSEWEQAVAKFVAVGDRAMQKRWISLAATLPRFFNLNVTKKRLSELKKSVPDGMHFDFDSTDSNGDPLVAKLRFVEKFVERNASRNKMTYIFTQNYANDICSIVDYSVDRKDIDKISMLDFIVDNHKLITCKLEGQSQKFIGEFNSIRVKNIQFIST